MIKPERIGIYGGTFNPVHHGHLLMARDVREMLNLDRMILVPNQRSPLRVGEPLLDGAHRLAMLRLAVANEEHFEVSEYELSRGGVSYTVETLRHFADVVGGDLHFIIGADSLMTFDRWLEVGEIVELADVLVVPRPGFNLDQAKVDLEARSPGLSERLTALPDNRHIDIASSEIRERLEAGKSVRYLVPDVVADYIANHGLYR